jgi:hypothetical protein
MQWFSNSKDKQKIEELHALISEQNSTIKMLRDKIDKLEGKPKMEESVYSYRRPKNRPVTISSEDDYFPSAVAAITAIYNDSSDSSSSSSSSYDSGSCDSSSSSSSSD